MIPFPDKKYKVIYADPPWKYQSESHTAPSSKGGARERGYSLGVRYYYPTMTFEELAALPVVSIADTDAVLFLWVTNPLLPKQLALMDDWGFRYKTLITWYKTNSKGGGYWFRGFTEHLALGVRGKVDSFRCMEPNHKPLPTGKHSEKPQEFRQMIEQATKGMEPRIELFARQKAYGWDAWGNQVENLPTIEEYSLS